MKPSQVLITIIGVFFLLIISLVTVSVSPSELFAQPPLPPTIGEPPIINSELPVNATQTPSTQTSPTLSNEDYFVYLPIINTPSCILSIEEFTLAFLIATDSNQIRPSMNCNPTLAEVARSRALDMGQRNYFDHVNPDGVGPNYLVSQAGYTLPDGWTTPATLNYIESIASGYPTAGLAFNAWMNSAGHRTHILGQDIFWATQTNFGVGYAYVENSTYKHYWVFISAPPQP